MLKRRIQSALLIDFDNLIGKFGAPFCDRVENWLNWLEDGCFDPGGPKRTFLLKRVYWFTDNDVNRPFFAKHGIDVSVTRAVKNKEKASSADFDITIDAVEMSHQKKLDELIILSFDSDFLTVLNHLQVKDISVGGMAFGDDRPAKAFRRLVDHVIEKEEFDVALRYVRPKRSFLGGTIEQPQEDLPPRPVKPSRSAAPPPPRVAAAKPAAPTKPAPRPRNVKPVFDLERAATLCAEAAASAPSAYLSKRFVTRALEGFDGFALTGPYPWLGCGSYEAMLQRFAKINPTLSVGRVASGALALIYQGGASEAA
jgi:uncharacterized LabA/DUF88 family protein